MNINFFKSIIPMVVLVTTLISSIYIGKFFNISYGEYLGYILWFIGLTIFYYILPNQRNSVFLK